MHGARAVHLFLFYESSSLLAPIWNVCKRFSKSIEVQMKCWIYDIETIFSHFRKDYRQNSSAATWDQMSDEMLSDRRIVVLLCQRISE